jgi:hypothetical protein
MRRFRATLATLALTFAATSAHASDDADALERRAPAAVVTGTTLFVVPFAIGGTMAALATSTDVRRGSMYVSSIGLTLAPLVAHGMLGEWGRGSLFSLVPLACGVGLAALMQMPDGDVLSELGSRDTRVPFWILASVGFAASAAGVVDATFAPSRARRSAFYVVPSPTKNGVALSIGGTF